MKRIVFFCLIGVTALVPIPATLAQPNPQDFKRFKELRQQLLDPNPLVSEQAARELAEIKPTGTLFASHLISYTYIEIIPITPSHASMARKPRYLFWSEQACYHIFNREHNREVSFVATTPAGTFSNCGSATVTAFRCAFTIIAYWAIIFTS